MRPNIKFRIIHRLPAWLLRLYYGEPKALVITYIEGHVYEIEFFGRGDKSIGWWQGGSYYPNAPYQGNWGKLRLEDITGVVVSSEEAEA